MKKLNNLKPKFWSKDSSLKTLDIQAKEWFDKVNGNSYFGAVVTCNFGMKNEFSFSINFSYGYGNYSEQRAIEILNAEGITDCEYYTHFHDKNILVRHNKQEHCLKRDVVAFGLSITRGVY